jgi:hypothetical protein
LNKLKNILGEKRQKKPSVCIEAFWNHAKALPAGR